MDGLFKDSEDISYEKIVNKLDKFNKLRREMTDSKILYLKKKGEGIFVGDIHGDFEALISIVKQTDFIKKMKSKKKIFLIFLGDYGDRGKKTLETINEILALKLRYPENVVLLRGNHEEAGMAKSYGTYSDFVGTFGTDNGNFLFDLYCSVMGRLPAVVITGNGIIGVHGGIPSVDIDSVKIIDEPDGKSYVWEMTWNDPSEKISGREPNGRGRTATYFGNDAFNKFMKAVPAKLMVRSHEYFSEGFKLYFNNRLATIFSNGSNRSVSSAYSNIVDHPVFLRIDLNKEKSRFEKKDFIKIEY